MKTILSIAVALVAFQTAVTAQARSVLMISVDGMNPEYVTEADSRGIDMPNMESFLEEGSYASGVTGVLPTVSWPSAATLMTGVEPARHGVLNNSRFVPPDSNRGGGIYFFASDVKADTLWDAAARAGLVTANVDQLVSVGNPNVHYDIPRFEPFSSWEENRKAIEAMARPATLLPELEAKLGTYVGVDFDDPNYDRSRAEFAIEIMRRYKPQFMSIHLSGVDVNAHAHGPYSPEAISAAESIDILIGELRAAALAMDPAAIVAVVSDHGQLPFTRTLNARTRFVEAGLIDIDEAQLGKDIQVVDWQADFWGNAIMLKDPTDAAVETKVRALLQQMAFDQSNGIARVLEVAEIREMGGFPGASFFLEMKEGTVLGASLFGELITEFTSVSGFHGAAPDNPGMNAAFFVAGKNIRPSQNLGQIDMRQIAPTLAQALDITLEDAREPALPVFVSRDAR